MNKINIRMRSYFSWALLWNIVYLIGILCLPILALLWQAKERTTKQTVQSLLQPLTISAYEVTLTSALLATIVNVILGLILAWVLVKYNFSGKKCLDAAIDLPFALPTSVGGFTLITVYNETGWLGRWSSRLGIYLVFNRLGIFIAMIFVSLPFIVRSLQPVLENMPVDIEEAAWCLGASPWTTFWCIVMPQLRSSLVTGTVLCFARNIGEYGSIVLVSSNIPRKDLVLSVLIFQKLEQYDYQAATLLATLVLHLAFFFFLLVNYVQIHLQHSTR